LSDDAECTVREDGSVLIRFPERVYRFLFSDGRTVDVVCVRDDSTERSLVRELLSADLPKDKRKDFAIAGVVRLEGRSPT
jgi:hypothetical protein